jgi:hypothetical protein
MQATPHEVRVYLDELRMLRADVGYGALGLRGDLGYEGSRVVVGGRRYERTVSAHAPSSVVFQLDRRFSAFECLVALNDDVPFRASYADFSVVADGRTVAVAPNVGAGERARHIAADVTGAATLALVADTRHWQHCHSVWLDPAVRDGAAGETPGADALARADVQVPADLPAAGRCIATVVSPGYAHLLDDMLASIAANGCCDDAIKVVFAFNPDDQCCRVIAKHGGYTVTCRPRARMAPSLKAVVYSVARFVNAEAFLCLDADTLVLGSLRPIFEAITVCPRGSILVCRDAFLGQSGLLRELCTHYAGKREDLELLIGRPFDEASYPLAVNDGVFGGSRGALLALDGFIRALPNAIAWVDQRADHGWRNQFIFNLALARMNCAVELDSACNLQVHMCDVQIGCTSAGVEASWRGRPVRILHFCGWGRDRYPEVRGLYASGLCGASAASRAREAVAPGELE